MNILKYIKRIYTKNIYKILIIDDVEENIILLNNYLQSINNIEIDSRFSAIEAEELIKTKDYSLILLDIQLPIMNGFEFAKKIKSNFYNRNMNTPLVFITGIYENDIDKIKGYNIGSIDYITKPIYENQFIKKIKYYLDNMNKGTDYFIKIKNNNLKKSVNI